MWNSGAITTTRFILLGSISVLRKFNNNVPIRLCQIRCVQQIAPPRTMHVLSAFHAVLHQWCSWRKCQRGGEAGATKNKVSSCGYHEYAHQLQENQHRCSDSHFLQWAKIYLSVTCDLMLVSQVKQTLHTTSETEVTKSWRKETERQTEWQRQKRQYSTKTRI